MHIVNRLHCGWLLHTARDSTLLQDLLLCRHQFAAAHSLPVKQPFLSPSFQNFSPSPLLLPAVDKDVLRINVEKSEEKKEEKDEQGRKWHR